MRTLEAVELSFFEKAPKLVTVEALVDAPRERVFAAVAAQPGSWGRWFPGFSDDGRWETPSPYGVGSVRTVRVFGIRYRELILAWDNGRRWAFRVDETTAPMFKAIAEDYQFADEGTGTRLSWTVGVRPSLAPLVSARLMRVYLRIVLRRASMNLGRILAATEPGGWAHEPTSTTSRCLGTAWG